MYGALHAAGWVPADPAEGVVVFRAAVDTCPGNARIGVWRWSGVGAGSVVLVDVLVGEVAAAVLALALALALVCAFSFGFAAFGKCRIVGYTLVWIRIWVRIRRMLADRGLALSLAFALGGRPVHAFVRSFGGTLR